MSASTISERSTPAGEAVGIEPGHLALPSLSTLILLAVGFRITALFLFRYGSPAPDWSDFVYYRDVVELTAQGFYPDIHFWVEYPPLFPWLAVGAYRLSLLLPHWTQPNFWFEFILTIVLAIADSACVVSIDRLGDAFWGKSAGRRSATIYAALFLPAFAVIAWFDTIALAFLLGALALLVATRSNRTALVRANSPPDLVWPSTTRVVAAGIAVGVGAMVKLFPVLALPAAVLVDWSAITSAAGSANHPADGPTKNGQPTSFSPLKLPSLLSFRVTTIAVVAMAITILAIALPFLIVSPETFLATFRNVLARGSWMSPWALLDGYYGTGVVASLHDRLFFNASAGRGQPSRYPGLWYAATAIGAGLYIWRGLAALRMRTPRAAIALTGFTVALMLLLSRGFSQQYTLWLLPFVILLMPGVDGAILAVALTFNDLVVEGYLYVNLFPSLHRLLYVSIAIRTVLLFWFAIEAAVAIDPATTEQFHQIRRRLVAPASAIAIVMLVAAVAFVGPSLRQAALELGGDAPFVSALQQLDPTTPVVFTQPDVYDRLYAAVQPRPAILLAEPGLLTWTGDRSLNQRLATDLTGRPTVVLVTDPAQPPSPVLPAVRQWLDARYGSNPARDLSALTFTEFQEASRPPEQSVGVSFGDSIVLRGISPPNLSGHPGSPLAVTLHWEAVRATPNDYTISVQLLDPGGKLVAQHDGMPVNNTVPTSTWHQAEPVYDSLALDLPAQLTTGHYSLIVVVYDHQTLKRLPTQGPGAQGDHATVATVQLTAKSP